MADDDLQQLEHWAGQLLAKLEPAARSRLARDIARDLRRSQQRRIAASRAPDGSPFPARKKPKEPRNKPVRFLYKKPGGDQREASMVSYQPQGPRMTGFDREAGGLRTFRKDRIVRFLPARGAGGGTLASKRGAIRRRKEAMFGRLRTARYLKIKATAEGAEVGFYGRVARLARVHQYGLRDRVDRDGPTVDYPQRQLLGFSEADRVMVRDRLLDHLGR